MPRLEHVGIAVEEVEEVIMCFQDLLGTAPYKAESVSEQQVRTHFLDAGSSKLELLEALADDSPVQTFLDKRGEGLHHLAFEVDDANATMARLRDAGFTILSDRPQPGADDKRIFFVHPKETHGVLVEFCESTAPTWTPTRMPHRNGDLAVYERGSPDHPTLIVLHGAAGSTLLDSAPLMRRLEPAFHVVGIDLSGHGASSLPPDDELTLDRFAEDVLAALDALDVDSAHLFGFSLGASVALWAAHNLPDRVDRLALLSPNLVWTEALVKAMTARLDVDTLREHRPDRAELLQAHHDHPERLFPALRSFVATLPDKSDAALEALDAVKHPTLVTALDEDPLFPLDAATTVHERLPNARLSVLPGSQHSLRKAPLAALTPLLCDHFSGDAELSSSNL
jgi:methylmalonyl-CoA epimerase